MGGFLHHTSISGFSLTCPWVPSTNRLYVGCVVCVWAFAHVFMHGDEYLGAQWCMGIHVETGINIVCIPPSLFTLLSEAESLMNAECIDCSWSSWTARLYTRSKDLDSIPHARSASLSLLSHLFSPSGILCGLWCSQWQGSTVQMLGSIPSPCWHAQPGRGKTAGREELSRSAPYLLNQTSRN